MIFISKKQILLNVSGQVLTCTNEDSLSISGDSIGQYEVVVTLDSWWDDYDITVQFRKCGIVIDNTLDTDNKCSDFDAIFSGGGNFDVTVYGINTSGFKKTTNPITIEVSSSGLRNTTPVNFIQSVWTKIRAMLEGGTTGQFLRKTSNNDYEAEWVDGYSKDEIDNLLAIYSSYENLVVASAGFTFEYVPADEATHDTTEPYYATIGYYGEDTLPVIPYAYDDGEHGMHRVETVKSSTFYENTSITGIVIPKGIIEFYGLFRCTSVGGISIPNSVKVLDVHGSSLTSLTVPNSVTSLDCHWDGDSSYPSQLESVVIYDGMTYLKDGAFTGCNELRNVRLPDTITTIGEYAFQNCTSLGYIKIPRSTIEVKTHAFVGCTSLKDVDFSGGSPTLRSYAFSHCDIRNVINMNSESIGEGCFQYNINLGYINLPCVTFVAQYAFQCCMRLTIVVFSNNEVVFVNPGAFMFTWNKIKAYFGYSSYSAESRESDFPGLIDDVYNALGSTDMILPYLSFWFPDSNASVYTFADDNEIDYMTVSDYSSIPSVVGHTNEVLTIHTIDNRKKIMWSDKVGDLTILGDNVNYTAPASYSPSEQQQSQTLSVLGDGSAYVYAADVTNSVETAFGASTNGNGFIGTLTNDDFDIRTGNIKRILVDADGSIVFYSPSGSSNVNIDPTGNIKPSGYKSSDGSSGATGTFTTADSKTVTVKDGIITSIV